MGAFDFAVVVDNVAQRDRLEQNVAGHVVEQHDIGLAFQSVAQLIQLAVGGRAG